MADTAAKTTDFVSSLLDGTLQDQLAKAFAAIQHGAEEHGPAMMDAALSAIRNASSRRP